MSGVDHLQEDQGWSDDTMLMLAMRFISGSGQQDAFVTYCERVADEENL